MVAVNPRGEFPVLEGKNVSSEQVSKALTAPRKFKTSTLDSAVTGSATEAAEASAGGGGDAVSVSSAEGISDNAVTGRGKLKSGGTNPIRAGGVDPASIAQIGSSTASRVKSLPEREPTDPNEAPPESGSLKEIILDQQDEREVERASEVQNEQRVAKSRESSRQGAVITPRAGDTTTQVIDAALSSSGPAVQASEPTEKQEAAPSTDGDLLDRAREAADQAKEEKAASAPKPQEAKSPTESALDVTA